MRAIEVAHVQPVRQHFQDQAAACRQLGSPFTAMLLETAAERLDDTSALGKAVLGWPGDPKADALALRFAGGLHALVLSGAAPALARVYPGAEVTTDPDTLWPAVGGRPRGACACAAALSRKPAADQRGGALRRAARRLPGHRAPDRPPPGPARDRRERGAEPALGRLCLWPRRGRMGTGRGTASARAGMARAAAAPRTRCGTGTPRLRSAAARSGRRPRSAASSRLCLGRPGGTPRAPRCRARSRGAPRHPHRAGRCRRLGRSLPRRPPGWPRHRAVSLDRLAIPAACARSGASRQRWRAPARWRARTRRSPGCAWSRPRMAARPSFV